MVKTNAQGEKEIIVKKGTKITAYKVSGNTTAGDGERLGYRLPARRRTDHLRPGRPDSAT